MEQNLFWVRRFIVRVHPLYLAAPSVHETLHADASMNGAAAALTAARAQQRGHPRMAMHVGSNAATPDYLVDWLGASELARPPRRGWTTLWSTGFVDYYPNSFLLVTCNL